MILLIVAIVAALLIVAMLRRLAGPVIFILALAFGYDHASKWWHQHLDHTAEQVHAASSGPRQ